MDESLWNVASGRQRPGGPWPLRARLALRRIGPQSTEQMAGTPPGSDPLARLSPECRHMLDVAAAVGISFTACQVGELLRVPVATLLPAMTEAMRHDVLVADGRRMAFRDAETWQRVVRSIPAPLLADLQREVTRPDGDGDGEPDADGHSASGYGGGWSSLTEIERTIAGLVGQGLTNRQVSGRVYRSPHTVNYHLRRIFRKLNIRSRVELARRIPRS